MLARAQFAGCAAGALAAILACLPTAGADWVEVDSRRFAVFSDAGTKTARRVAAELEQARLAFAQMLPGARTDPGVPVVVLAARNEKSLRVLLPEFFESGVARPAGVFVRGRDSHHVALRTDLRGHRSLDENPYQVLYHELAHLLLSLNFEHLPVWLAEGLAEFYGATVVRDDDIVQGKPIARHVLLLRQHRLMPFDILFRVDHDSPEYSEATKAGVFYAQSWALVHLQLTHPDGLGGQRIADYQRAIGDGVDSLAAARAAFGDLKQLEGDLRNYVTGRGFRYGTRPLPKSQEDVVTTARRVAPAEMLARMGEFHAARGRWTEAKAALLRALDLDAGLAAAHAALGMLALDGDRVQEARARLQRAVELAPTSVVMRFRLASVEALGPGRVELQAARASLDACLAIDADYAPAWALLAEVRSRLRVTPFDETLALARRAVDLEPGSFDYRLALARVLASTGRISEASREASRAMRVASRAAEVELARLLLLMLEAPRVLPEDRVEAVLVLENLCQEGRVADCGRLAERLREGNGVPADPARAAILDGEACDAGHLPACSRLARALELGDGVPEDPVRAAALSELACDGGAAFSCGELGWAYERGHGVPADAARAALLYERACNAGMLWSCQQLAYLYERGRGVRRDPERAAALYPAACEDGESFSCWRLGGLLETGRGLAQDVDEAAALYERACRGDLPEACFDLGRLRAAGRGVSLDTEGAAAAYQAACDNAVASGCVSLGRLVARGAGVSRDAERAGALFAIACENGAPEGCTEAGLHELAEAGAGAQRRAAAWLERGCEGNDPRACASLASQLEFGLGVPKDTTRARRLYRKACAAGHAPACQH